MKIQEGNRWPWSNFWNVK